MHRTSGMALSSRLSRCLNACASRILFSRLCFSRHLPFSPSSPTPHHTHRPFLRTPSLTPDTDTSQATFTPSTSSTYTTETKKPPKWAVLQSARQVSSQTKSKMAEAGLGVLVRMVQMVGIMVRCRHRVVGISSLLGMGVWTRLVVLVTRKWWDEKMAGGKVERGDAKMVWVRGRKQSFHGRDGWKPVSNRTGV